jgi:hypothetical protein
MNNAGCWPSEIILLVTSYASKTLPSVSASTVNGYVLVLRCFTNSSWECGAMATMEAPVAVSVLIDSRNCARCLRQNGQKNPRRKTSTTGPVVWAVAKVQGEPSAWVRAIAGAVSLRRAVREDRVPMGLIVEAVVNQCTASQNKFQEFFTRRELNGIHPASEGLPSTDHPAP